MVHGWFLHFGPAWHRRKRPPRAHHGKWFMTNSWSEVGRKRRERSAKGPRCMATWVSRFPTGILCSQEWLWKINCTLLTRPYVVAARRMFALDENLWITELNRTGSTARADLERERKNREMLALSHSYLMAIEQKYQCGMWEKGDALDICRRKIVTRNSQTTHLQRAEFESR